MMIIEILSIIIGTLMITCITVTTASDWPLYRNTAGNTGYSTETINLPLTEQWHSSTPHIEENGVVVANGIAYTSTEDGYLYAFTVSTGAIVPGYPKNTANSYGTPAVDKTNDRVYVIAGTSLYAFHLDGTTAWTQNVGSVGYNYNEGPIIEDGFVYLLAGGQLRKYNSVGDLQWSSSAGGGNTQPSLMGHYIYSNTGNLIQKFNKISGVQIISGGFPISVSDSESSITTIDGKIFLKADKLYVYDASNGNLIWSQPCGGNSFYYDSPAVANGIVYVYGWDGKMYAFDENLGATMTGFPSVTLNTPKYRNWGSPAIAGDKIFIGAGTSQKLKVLGAAGTTSAGQVLDERQLYSNDQQGIDLCSPVISDGFVLITLDGGGLYAFRVSQSEQMNKPVEGTIIKSKDAFRGYYITKDYKKGDYHLDTLVFKPILPQYPKGFHIIQINNGELYKGGKKVFYNKYDVYHEGIDIYRDTGTPVYPAASGTIKHICNWNKEGPGKYVFIWHGDAIKLDGTLVNKISTRYLHLDEISDYLKEKLIELGHNPDGFDGEVNIPITSETMIGKVGKTGCPGGIDPHLHLEVRQGDDLTCLPYNTLPLNPCEFIEYQGYITPPENPKPYQTKTLCPVDIIITDPDGLIISKETNQLPTSSQYIEVKDGTSGEGPEEIPNDNIVIYERKMGMYIISIIPEPGAEPTDTYNLQIIFADAVLPIAENVTISNIPDEPYIVKSNESGIYAAPIPAFTYLPENPIVNQLITFNASLSMDPDGYITNWTWNFGDGGSSALQNPTHIYTDDDRTYHVTLTVTDNDGLSGSITKDVIVRNPPLVANAGGPYYGYSNTDICFTGSAVGGEPPYYFSWDIDNDGEFDDAFGNVSHHSFDVPGVYTISLNVRDTDWHYSISTTQVNVSRMVNPPDIPDRPSGLANGKTGVEYTYVTSTIDSEGDQVYYLWDWGDGSISVWDGPYSSGATCEAKHTWTVKNTYNIKVKAKDMYGAESPWSDPLPITMPYSYNPMQQFLEWLFEHFPHAFPILRQLLGY